MAHSKYLNAKGEVVPSVTQIIGDGLGWGKQALIGWAYKLGKEGKNLRETKKTACDTGTLTHAYFEHHIKQITNHPDLAECEKELDKLKKTATFDAITVAERALERFIVWMDENTVFPAENGSEIKIVNEENQFGGTCDFLAFVNGVLTLIDFKTGKYITADNIIQMAAYSVSINSLRELEIQNHILIHIRKDFDPEKEVDIFEIVPIEMNTINDGWVAFTLLRKLYDLKANIDPFAKGKKKDGNSDDSN